MSTKKKFNITRKIKAELEKTANELPKFQRMDPAGNPLTRTVARYVKGSEVPEEARKDIEDFSEENTYKTFIDEPVLINHAIAVRLCYLQNGQEGVNAYCDFYKYQQEKQSKEFFDLGMLNQK